VAYFKVMYWNLPKKTKVKHGNIGDDSLKYEKETSRTLAQTRHRASDLVVTHKSAQKLRP
jgi:hypothetical protein